MFNVAEEKLIITIRKKWKPAVKEIKKANQTERLYKIYRLLDYTTQALHKHQNHK